MTLLFQCHHVHYVLLYHIHITMWLSSHRNVHGDTEMIQSKRQMCSQKLTEASRVYQTELENKSNKGKETKNKNWIRSK